MTAVYQLLGAFAIALGLAGTWLAARHRSGWLICVTSSTMWIPALVTGEQWVAVGNCGLSMAICIRNFATKNRTKDRPAQTPSASHATKEIGAQQRVQQVTTQSRQNSFPSGSAITM